MASINQGRKEHDVFVSLQTTHTLFTLLEYYVYKVVSFSVI